MRSQVSADTRRPCLRLTEQSTIVGLGEHSPAHLRVESASVCCPADRNCDTAGAGGGERQQQGAGQELTGLGLPQRLMAVLDLVTRSPAGALSSGCRAEVRVVSGCNGG